VFSDLLGLELMVDLPEFPVKSIELSEVGAVFTGFAHYV